MAELPLALVDGRPQQSIEVTDRGLHYGDGVFRTLLAWDGRIVDGDAQLARLREDARRLQIPAPDDALWWQDIQSLPPAALERAAIKLILTRGSGQRGYAIPARSQPKRLLFRYPLAEHPTAYWERGISLGVCETRLGHNPALAGIKHLNRLEQVLARSEPAIQDHAEGLMLDGADRVVCGTMSNLFVVTDGVLRTPRLEGCGVNGLTRRRIIELAKKQDIEISQTALDMQDCLNAQECFVSNSLIGIWPVRQLLGQKWSPGPLTRQMQQVLGHPRIPV